MLLLFSNRQSAWSSGILRLTMAETEVLVAFCNIARLHTRCLPCSKPTLALTMHFHAVIWDALKAACDADLPTAKIILESAGVVVASDNMTVCYDERGAQGQALPQNISLARLQCMRHGRLRLLLK